MIKRFRKLPTRIVLIVLLILGLLLPYFLSSQQKISRAQGLSPNAANYAKNDSDFHKDLAKQPKGTKSRKSPFAEVENLGNGEFKMETSILPKTKADGEDIDLTWYKQGSSDIYNAGTNLFSAVVEKTKITLEALNDQPDGRKKNDKLMFYAQLFLNKIEQTPTGPVLLAVDPVNSNYHNNVLEWDFGIAKRRVRIIEGRFQGTWVFSQNPNGEVRIKYNQTGNYKLRLGQYATDGDTEVVPASVFASATYPFTVSDSATYYPDAHPETTSVDGYVLRSIVPSGEAWTTLKAGAGTHIDDSGVWLTVMFCSDNSIDQWERLYRAIILFDTSALPDTATVTAGTLSVYGRNKAATTGNTPTYNVYASTPASNIALVAADYGQTGSTAFSTAITSANIQTGSPGISNDFALNASGIAAISLTGVSKYSIREATYDAGSSTPTWTDPNDESCSGVNFHPSENGTGYQPKLVVTYTLPNTAPTNDSLTFTNPYTGGSNNAVADNTTEWNFRAVVSDTDGYANLGTVVLRLANSTDSTTPFDSLKFTWTEATDAFSETADTQSAAAITSTNADSTCATNTCTLDFKIKFNSSFSTQSTNYGAELYTTDDAAATDEDSYATFYQVTPVTISITSPSDVSLGTITGTGTSSTGEATWTITTNNPAGYKLEWQASTATMANQHSDTIAAYTPAVADTPETWSVAAAASEWGGRLKSTSTDYASGTWGADDTTNAKWLDVKSSAVFQIASRASVTTGSNEIVQFKAEIGSSKFQPTGAYTVNVTITATTL